MPKHTVLDPQGQTIQHALGSLGYAQVKDVRQGKFFVLDLNGWSREEAQQQRRREEVQGHGDVLYFLARRRSKRKARRTSAGGVEVVAKR